MAGSDVGWLSIIGGVLLMIHRAPLMHAIVGYPTGRISGRVRVALVIAAYAYAVVAPITRDELATILIATSLMALTIWTYHRSTGPHRQARLIAVAAAAVLVMPLLTGSIGRLAGAGPEIEGALIWIYPGGGGAGRDHPGDDCRVPAGLRPR